MSSIKVTHISTYDLKGGAGIAATRLHLALRNSGVDSSHMVRFKTGTDPYTYIGDAPSLELSHDAIVAGAIQSEYIDGQRTALSNTLFSLGYPGIDLSSHPVVARSHVINLHWVSYFLSVESIGRLLATGLPVVWTLHDQHAFTGGCHYSAGCSSYTQGCECCPQLISDKHGLVPSRLQDRRILFSRSQQPLIVAPSEWMRRCAQGSSVFRDAEIITIPNSVPIDKFFPGTRDEARKILGIERAGPCILFGADNHAEKRKGFTELMAAVHACLNHESTAGVLRRATFLCFGESTEQLAQLGLQTVSLGRVADQYHLRLIYVAADMFVLPSLEDNLPNTALESLACGTPVLAFDSGGLPEIVQHGNTGWLVPSGDVIALGRALMDCLEAPERLMRWSDSARRDAVDRFSPAMQASRYLEMYDNLLSQGKGRHGFKAVCGAPMLDATRAPAFDSIFQAVAGASALPAYVKLKKEHEVSCADRVLRGHQIDELTALLKVSEDDRGQRGAQIETLSRMLAEAEADRLARWNQIEELTTMVRKLEIDRSTASKRVEELEADLGLLMERLRSLFSHSIVHWLAKLRGWREVQKLEESVKKIK